MLDHAEPSDAEVTTPPPTAAAPQPKKPKASTASADDDLRTLAVKLGGWDTDLADLESMEKDIEFVMDEDQKRTLDARRKR